MTGLWVWERCLQYSLLVCFKGKFAFPQTQFFFADSGALNELLWQEMKELEKTGRNTFCSYNYTSIWIYKQSTNKKHVLSVTQRNSVGQENKHCFQVQLEKNKLGHLCNLMGKLGWGEIWIGWMCVKRGVDLLEVVYHTWIRRRGKHRASWQIDNGVRETSSTGRKIWLTARLVWNKRDKTCHKTEEEAGRKKRVFLIM